MDRYIDIKEFNYDLPDNRIAKFPLEQRDSSKLLIYRNNNIRQSKFFQISEEIPSGALIVCNNTRVIHARLIFFKPTGARIEIFCLDPHSPADYETAFSTTSEVKWRCMIGNLKKWRGTEPLTTKFEHEGKEIVLTAKHLGEEDGKQLIEFSHNYEGHTFGDILDICGKIPIPPYLNRNAEESDSTTYQTVYSKYDGSVAAPTAGLHFTPRVFDSLRAKNCKIQEITLHVGAGTFLPVKAENAALHVMHTEHFDFTLEAIKNMLEAQTIVAVGTTSVRTIESISVLGYRIMKTGNIHEDISIGQWEAYDIPEHLTKKVLLGTIVEYMQKFNITRIKSSTQIMITPGYTFRVIDILVTNFHQPQSTLLLLISAIVGKENWRNIYSYAMNNGFRFLSYGDSSMLFLK